MHYTERPRETALLFGTFVIAVCGLVYELLESTISSYLLGDSVYHFSLVIGLFMSSMGIGAWLSRFVEESLEKAFVILQLSISVIGGFSALLLFYAFAYIQNYQGFLYLTTVALGSMLGMEIPLIIRILRSSFSLKSNISNVFTLDYIGALFAALLFPMVLLPQLGLMQTGFLLGILNLLVGFMAWYLFRELLGKIYIVIIPLIGTALLTGLFHSQDLTSFIESKLYRSPIIYSEQTPYQKLVATSSKGRIQFYINGAIQFDTLDEYRYHESLVHPVMGSVRAHENILIIGGGDGMSLREVLKYPDVSRITLVDLDPAMTKLFRDNPAFSAINGQSFHDKRVKVVNEDAWKFLENASELYDVIIIDLPDPDNLSLGRLYSQTFYTLVAAHLSRMGAMVTQSTSPLYSRRAFWCIEKTIESTGLKTIPYHTYVPSFGEWGFVLASGYDIPLRAPGEIKGLRYLSRDMLDTMLLFPADMEKLDVEINRLSDHRLIYYYEADWNKWYD